MQLQSGEVMQDTEVAVTPSLTLPLGLHDNNCHVLSTYRFQVLFSALCTYPAWPSQLPPHSAPPFPTPPRPRHRHLNLVSPKAFGLNCLGREE